MVSNAKLYSKLDDIEAQLTQLLVPHLQLAANGGNPLIFCVKAFNNFRQLKDQTDSLSDELIGIGSEVLSLRTKLGEPVTGIIADRVCWYCRKWCSAKQPQPELAKELAQKFLDEIKLSDLN